MHGNKSIDKTQKLRKEVSKIYFAVLTNKISVREALAIFPKECNDNTIIASWHALCHLDADEDIRKSDEMYKEEQDNYIEYIYNILEKGEALPINIINEYKEYHNDALIPENNNIKGIIHQLKRFLCE